ncbi:DPY30 domain-containing protein 1 [Aix galericulata]|nr:DPY30 domain-containing protein 1 [Aix galericulata]
MESLRHIYQQFKKEPKENLSVKSSFYNLRVPPGGERYRMTSTHGWQHHGRGNTEKPRYLHVGPVPFGGSLEGQRMLERIELEKEREAALEELEMLRKMKEEELMIQQKLEEQRQRQLEEERAKLELQNEEDKMQLQQKDQEEIEKTIAELTDRLGAPNLTSVEELDEGGQFETATDVMAEPEQENSQPI